MIIVFSQKDIRELSKISEYFRFMDCEEAYPGVADRLRRLDHEQWGALLAYRYCTYLPYMRDVVEYRVLDQIENGEIYLTEDESIGRETQFEGLRLVVANPTAKDIRYKKRNPDSFQKLGCLART